MFRADNFLVQSFNHFIVIFIKQQTKNEEVTRFWIDLDNERMELEIKQTQVCLASYIKYQDAGTLLTQFLLMVYRINLLLIGRFLIIKHTT